MKLLFVPQKTCYFFSSRKQSTWEMHRQGHSYVKESLQFLPSNETYCSLYIQILNLQQILRRGGGDRFVFGMAKSSPVILILLFFIQLFQKRLSWSIVDTGTERNFGYTYNK